MNNLKIEEICKELTGNEIKLYFILKNNCNEKLECKMAIRYIASEYNLSPKTVGDCINGLIEKRYIQKIKRIDRDGYNLTNLYRIIGGI